MRGCCSSPAGKGQGCGPAERKQGRGQGQAEMQRHVSESEQAGRNPTPASLVPPLSSATRTFQSPTCFIIPTCNLGCIQLWKEQFLASTSCPLFGLRTERLPHNESHGGDSQAPCAFLILESPTPRCPECSFHPNTSPPKCLLKNRQPGRSRENAKASSLTCQAEPAWPLLGPEPALSKPEDGTPECTLRRALAAVGSGAG